jgi:ABC-2 type transport system permease protein
MLWSVMSPLLSILVMYIVFKNFYNRGDGFFITYLFCGIIVFSFFSDASNGGMESLLGNADIFSKINLPKYLFLFSRTVSSLINFSLTFGVFLIFCAIDGVPFTIYFAGLIIPIILLIIFNLGVGMILSALYVFFRDVKYLWSIFLMLVMYLSAIFYDVEMLPDTVEKLLLLNPVYIYITYFRALVIGAAFPPVYMTVLAVVYATLFFLIGAVIYKKYNHKFIYYV